VFLRVGEALGIDRLLDLLRRAEADDRWSRSVRQGLLDDLDELRRVGAQRVLEDQPGTEPVEAFEFFLRARSAWVDELSSVLRSVEREPVARLDAITVAARAVRRAIV